MFSKNLLTLSQTSPGVYVSAVQVFRKPFRKRRLLMTSNFIFPTMFSFHLETFLLFSSIFKLSSAFILSLEESKIFRHSGKAQIVVCRHFQFCLVPKFVVWEKVQFGGIRINKLNNITNWKNSTFKVLENNKSFISVGIYLR